MTNDPRTALDAAVEYATLMHQGQRRSGTDRPYITHPVEVMRILAREGVTDTATLAAAVLHDVVEDTAATLDDVRERFGAEVAAVVGEVTDDPALSKKENRERKIHGAPTMSWRAKLVKIADAISNVQDTNASCPEGWNTSLKKAYLKTCARVVEGALTHTERDRADWDGLGRRFDHELRLAMTRLSEEA